MLPRARANAVAASPLSFPQARCPGSLPGRQLQAAARRTSESYLRSMGLSSQFGKEYRLFFAGLVRLTASVGVITFQPCSQGSQATPHLEPLATVPPTRYWNTVAFFQTHWLSAFWARHKVALLNASNDLRPRGSACSLRRGRALPRIAWPSRPHAASANWWCSGRASIPTPTDRPWEKAFAFSKLIILPPKLGSANGSRWQQSPCPAF